MTPDEFENQFEPFEPFYAYLEAERQALLTKLDKIERIMGTSPRTAEIRKKYKAIIIGESDSVGGVVKYD